MLSELNKIVEKATEHNNKYEFEKAKFITDRFFWGTFCDTYLELVKDRLYKPEVYGEEAQKSGQYTVYHTLKTLTQIFHPICTIHYRVGLAILLYKLRRRN